MSRQRFRVAALLVLIAEGCRADADRREAPSAQASGAAPTASAPVVLRTSPFIDSLFADLRRAVAPEQVTWSAMIAAIRADSGSARADSAFRRFQQLLDQDLEGVGRVVRDHDLEDLFHLTWMHPQKQAEYLNAHGIPNDTIVPRAIVDSIYHFLANHSISTLDGEGGPSFSVDAAALSKAVGRYLSPATRDYLELSLLDQSRPGSDDGYLQIPWNEFGDRIAQQDRFVSTYPTSPFADELRPWLANGLRLYLQGSEAFDAPVPELPDQAKANIAYFLGKYGSTPAGAIVRQYRDALATQGYRGGQTLLDQFARGR